MTEVIKMMRPISDQLALGRIVKLFLKNGKETVGHCTLIYPIEGSCYLNWYVKKRKIDADKIKGWMPLTPTEDRE